MQPNTAVTVGEVVGRLKQRERHGRLHIGAQLILRRFAAQRVVLRIGAGDQRSIEHAGRRISASPPYVAKRVFGSALPSRRIGRLGAPVPLRKIQQRNRAAAHKRRLVADRSVSPQLPDQRMGLHTRVAAVFGGASVCRRAPLRSPICKRRADSAVVLVVDASSIGVGDRVQLVSLLGSVEQTQPVCQRSKTQVQLATVLVGQRCELTAHDRSERLQIGAERIIGFGVAVHPSAAEVAGDRGAVTHVVLGRGCNGTVRLMGAGRDRVPAVGHACRGAECLRVLRQQHELLDAKRNRVGSAVEPATTDGLDIGKRTAFHLRSDVLLIGGGVLRWLGAWLR